MPVELEPRTPMQSINFARSELINADFDVKKTIHNWIADPMRATTDISVNRLMEAHLFIAEAIRALNDAQAHTED